MGIYQEKRWCSTVLRSHKARSSIELRHSPWSENFSVTGGFSNLNTFNFWETGKNGDDFSIYKSVHIYHFKILKTKKIKCLVLLLLKIWFQFDLNSARKYGFKAFVQCKIYLFSLIILRLKVCSVHCATVAANLKKDPNLLEIRYKCSTIM